MELYQPDMGLDYRVEVLPYVALERVWVEGKLLEKGNLGGGWLQNPVRMV